MSACAVEHRASNYIPKAIRLRPSSRCVEGKAQDHRWKQRLRLSSLIAPYPLVALNVSSPCCGNLSGVGDRPESRENGAHDPVTLAGYCEAIAKDDGHISRLVTLPFAARWISGEPVLNHELTEALWLEPANGDGPQDDGRASGNHRECGGDHDKAVGGKWETSRRMAKAPCPAPVPPYRCLAFRLLRRRWEHRQLVDVARIVLDDDRGLEVGGDLLEAVQGA